MSRLFAVVRSAEEIAKHFGVAGKPDVDVPPETIEGTSGLVVVDREGRRLLKSLTWGFPRQTTEMRRAGEPQTRIGLVADLTNPMWEHVVVEPAYRCLVPLTHWANPEGEPGKKTRAWFSVRDEPLIAWAGFCRQTKEFGAVFAAMTMDANEAVKPYNDRMPCLLRAAEWNDWLYGTIQDVIKFQFRPPLPPEFITIEHTRNRWQSGIPPRSPFTSLAARD